MTQTKNRKKQMRVYELERIGNARTVQLYADGFDSLTGKEKIFAYYMAKAAIAGRPIAIDQTNEFAIGIINLCEDVLLRPKGVSPKTLKAVREYAKLFWINNGMYDYATARKFVPACTPEEFTKALGIAEKNRKKPSRYKGQGLKIFREVEKAMFDPDYMAVVTDKTPGHDFIAQSANNFYERLTTAQVDG